MANECQTQITFESSKEGINWLTQEIGKIWNIEPKDRQDFIVENFGIKANTIMESIGTKWIMITETTIEEGNLFVQTMSAAYPPNEMIKKIVSILVEKFDKNSRASGKYWDENFNTIGIFESNSTGYYEAEDSLDVNFDNENYWEDEVEPAFDKLEL